MAPTKCPDCGGDLHPIKLIDATDRTFGIGTRHVELSYAGLDPEIRWPIGSATSGRVKGHLCSDCSRIFLYAAPLE